MLWSGSRGNFRTGGAGYTYLEKSILMGPLGTGMADLLGGEAVEGGATSGSGSAGGGAGGSGSASGSGSLVTVASGSKASLGEARRAGIHEGGQ